MPQAVRPLISPTITAVGPTRSSFLEAVLYVNVGA